VAATSIVMLLPLLMEIERASPPRPLAPSAGARAEPTRFPRAAGEGQVIETDKLRIKDLKAQGFSDQQISGMGLTAAVEPSVGLGAPSSSSKPLALQ